MGIGNIEPSRSGTRKESKTTTFKKEILKEGFYKKDVYSEEFSFYDSLPKKLSVPKNFVSKRNDEEITEAEMTKDHEPFSKEEAAGLACELKKENKEGFIWFKDDNGELCFLSLDDFGRRVSVRSFIPGHKWKGSVSYFLS